MTLRTNGDRDDQKSFMAGPLLQQGIGARPVNDCSRRVAGNKPRLISGAALGLASDLCVVSLCGELGTNFAI